eukprot:CAMPEP_0176503936 /NCGR_PEP_ID=MMETSP0200_2-20121128/15654_1 /TAXON_ID=947934 /ORGANISM="Chaetoceros sp., Strain GSL56" /LENGTH=479 /DNA_ID=CAMNT_0017903311 /DNA_START=669 /DNA_END=2108 /DNA_ORIENTATION=+
MTDSSKQKNNNSKDEKISCSSSVSESSTSNDIGHKDANDKECNIVLTSNERNKTPLPIDPDADEKSLNTVTPSYSSKLVITNEQSANITRCDLKQQDLSNVTKSSNALDRHGTEVKTTQSAPRETDKNMLCKMSSSLEDEEQKLNEVPHHPLSSSSDTQNVDHGQVQNRQNVIKLNHQSENRTRDEVAALPRNLYGMDPPYRRSYFDPHDHVHHYRSMVARPFSPRFWNPAARDFGHHRIQPRYDLEETSNHRFPLGSIYPFDPHEMRPSPFIGASYPQYEQSPFPSFHYYEQGADHRTRPSALPLNEQTYISQNVKGHLALSDAKTINGKGKVILRRKCAWKNYPELEKFLIENRDEYLRHSAMNYTQEQKQYNNELTQKLLEVAKKHNYEFDPIDFNFVAIRDRIRCYYKSYVQNCKKRGVSVSFKANKKCRISDEEEEDDEKDNLNRFEVVPKQDGHGIDSEVKESETESCHGEDE